MATRPDPLYRSFILRYLAALALLALLLAGDLAILIEGSRRLEQDTVEAINLAGHQRMYLQRLGLLAWRLTFSERPEVREDTRQALLDTAQAMEAELLALPAVPADLKADLEEAIGFARWLAEQPEPGPTAEDPAFVALDAHVEALLPRLESYVSEREVKARAQFDSLRTGEWFSFGLGLALLTFLGIAVFRPMARRLQEDFRRRDATEAQLRAYAERLEQNNRDLQEFAYVASHDLQEPLRKILAFGDRLERLHGDELTPEGLDYLQRMLSASRRMQALIQGLLTYSRVTTRGRPFTQVDMNKVVHEVLEDLETVIEETGGEVEVGYLPTVEADPLQMRQLLQNLIANGLKFHRPGVPPRVRVEGRRRTIQENGQPREVTEIVVSDNGIGFDEKYLDRIFQPFQRLHGRTEYPGTGMGLAICRKIVERHNGTIHVRSQPGQGTTFTVQIPMITRPKEVVDDSG